MVKRELRTPSPAAKADEAQEPATDSISPKSKKLKTPDSSPSKPSTTFSDADRGRFLDDIIAAGAKSADLDALAVKYGVKKSQLVDQLKPNRGNIRAKAVKSVQGS